MTVGNILELEEDGVIMNFVDENGKHHERKCDNLHKAILYMRRK